MTTRIACGAAFPFPAAPTGIRHEYDFMEPGESIFGWKRFWLAGGGRQALGDLEELGEALERVSEYQGFQPRRCDRRENRRLGALSDQEVAAMTFEIRVVAIDDNGS